ncbi:MAG TPA: hypothetical protein VM261_05270 [Kofleriaceae bacterium]|nr:hypothetical protein [Kofleriaceae bacterium]
MAHRCAALFLLATVAAACGDNLAADGAIELLDAAPSSDATVDTTPLAGERCDDAQPVTLRGVSGATTLSATILASLGGYHADYAPHCTTQDELGADRVYRVTIPAGHRLDAKLSPTFPAALYVLAGPAASCAAACLAGEAIAATDQAFLSHDNTTGAPEDVFVVVDTVTELAAQGDFRLALRQSPTPVVAP